MPRRKSEPQAREESLIERGLRECGGERVTLAWLMENMDDYDDGCEEYYRRGWDRGDPSWECDCGHWSDGAFCPHCGAKRK